MKNSELLKKLVEDIEVDLEMESELVELSQYEDDLYDNMIV